MITGINFADSVFSHSPNHCVLSSLGVRFRFRTFTSSSQQPNRVKKVINMADVHFISLNISVETLLTFRLFNFF